MNKLTNHLLVSLAICVGLLGCEEEKVNLPLYEVAERPFEIEIPAIGHLESAEAQIIASPGMRPMVLSWLAEEYSSVEQGELIATFDGEQISVEAMQESLAMQLIEQDIAKQNAVKTKSETELSSEQELVDEEFEFSNKFNIEDVRVYSQLEIIDFSQNNEFLSAKDQFLDWKESSVEKQNTSSMQVLEIKKQGHEVKLNQKKDALAKLEVRAPYSGLLVYEKNWRGEKPSVGQTMFPGATIAKLPNLTKMQAKLYVLDVESIGLAEGQKVEIALDADPSRKLTGTVTKVSAFSRTIKRGNPAKYFELVASFDEQDLNLLKPGKKLSATVFVAQTQNLITVPLQAIHNRDGKNFVITKQSDGYHYREVSLGQKNLFFVEVTQGVNVGEQITLSLPEEGMING